MGRSQAPLCCGCCQMVGGRQGARPCLWILCFPVVLLQVAFRQIISCSQASGCANCRSPWPVFDFALIAISLPRGTDCVTQGLVCPWCRAWICLAPALDGAAIACWMAGTTFCLIFFPLDINYSFSLSLLWQGILKCADCSLVSYFPSHFLFPALSVIAAPSSVHKPMGTCKAAFPSCQSQWLLKWRGKNKAPKHQVRTLPSLKQGESSCFMSCWSTES